jgi:hypothetical protein
MSADQLGDLNWLIALKKHSVNGNLNDQTDIKSNKTLPILVFCWSPKICSARERATPFSRIV